MSGGNKRRYVVTYDVRDDRRRNQIHKILRGYGDNVQYSVFIADISPVSCYRLERSIGEVIASSEDSVYFFDLGTVGDRKAKTVRVLGQARLPEERLVVIL